MFWLIGAKDYEWNSILPKIAESSGQLRYIERVTGRQLRIGKNRRRLLGEDDLSEKQQKSEGSQNVHRRVFWGWLKRRASTNSNGFPASTIR
jgi:hypothetical protein